MKANPTTVEEFDYLTSKEFPEKLSVSPCRFLPDTVLDQYNTCAECKSMFIAGADLSKPFRHKSDSDEFDFGASA